MRQAASRHACSPSQPLLRRAAVLPAALRPPRQVAQASGGARAGGSRGDGGRGAAAKRRRQQRTDITFRVPGEAPRVFKRLTQADLSELLQLWGAKGFDTGDGKLSRRLEDLPEGGAVQVVRWRPPDRSTDEQARDLLQGFDSETLAKEQQRLVALLRQLASDDNAGGSITTLPTEPYTYTSARGQDCVQFDAAVVAGSTLYVGELTREQGGGSIGGLLLKFVKIRDAVSSGTSPHLAAALRDVTQIKLFLAGEGAGAGLSMEQVARVAGGVGVGVVLPSGQGLGLVGAASARPL